METAGNTVSEIVPRLLIWNGGAGQLVAFDPAQSRVRDFAIHRVTSIVSAEVD